MKKFWWVAVFAGVILSGCGQGDKVETKEVKFEINEPKTRVSLSVDFPVEAQNPTFLKQLQKVVNVPFIGAHNNPNAALDIEENLKSEAENFAAAAKQNVQELNKLGIEASGYAEYIGEMRKIADTDGFVTYANFGYVYTGGAHGASFWDSWVVDKKSGDVVSDDLLKVQTGEPEFKEILKQGVIAYLAERKGSKSFNPEQLQDELLDVVKADDLPLPAAKAFLLDDGVGFVYGEYEISYYANGNIAFVVPFDKMKPYLTPQAWALAEKGEKAQQIKPFFFN